MRRVRAIPRAASNAAAFGVGIQLTRSGISRAGAAAAESTDTGGGGGGTDSEPTCATPAAMRWRYYPSWTGWYTSTRDPEVEPPDWPYVFESFEPEEYSSADVPHDVNGFVLDNADTITFDMLETYGVARGLGWYIIDLVDSVGDAIDMRTNYALACFGPDANENPEIIEWAVRYVQSDAGSDNIPEVRRLPSGELVVVVDTSTINPGVLTISATDNWSPGAPQEFGPLTFVFRAPE